MKGFTPPLIFLAILGAATSKVIQAEDTPANVNPFEIGACWYRHKMCVTAGTTPQQGTYDNPTDCQTKCTGMTEDDCKFWVFKRPRDNAGQCYALTTCDNDIENGCTPSDQDDSHCVSSPRVCENPCGQMNYQPGLKAHWNCIHTGGGVVYPYQEDIPSGSICTAKCPKWVDASGDPVPDNMVQTTCHNAAWEPITPVTNPALETPDASDEAANPPCTCDPIKINVDSFQDTDNKGAELYCTDGSEADPDLHLKTGEVTIDGSMNCIMLCDKLFVMEVTCSQGKWSDGQGRQIENCTDFYCWSQPDTEDKCNF